MDPKLLWDEYKLQVETYRFYLELVIKINLFFYAITGGILSFYFASVNKEQVQLALVLPLVMSVLLFAFFLFGGPLAAGDVLLEPTKKAMEESLLPIFKNKIAVKASLLKEGDAAILGASALAWQEMAKN